MLASNNDLLAGTCGGREMIREAVEVPDSRKQLRLIRDFEVGDHFAPTRSSRKEKKTFWQPLDRIVADGPPPGAASAPVQRHETS